MRKRFERLGRVVAVDRDAAEIAAVEEFQLNDQLCHTKKGLPPCFALSMKSLDVLTSTSS